jgi:hypothetical protein
MKKATLSHIKPARLSMPHVVRTIRQDFKVFLDRLLIFAEFDYALNDTLL